MKDVTTVKKNLTIDEAASRVYSALIKGDEAKRLFDQNYLKILVHEHSDIPMQYLVHFLHQAQLSGADPRIKQIHLISYKDKTKGHMVGVPVYSYHFFLDRANQTKEFNGISVNSSVEQVFDPINNKEVKMLVATAKTIRKNHEIIFKARWSEFYNDRNSRWRKAPYIMLEKCAIANVLRWAFPEVLSGMYLPEEISENNDEFSSLQDAIHEDMERMAFEQTPLEERTKGPLYRIQHGKFRGQQLKDLDLDEIENYIMVLSKRSPMKKWEQEVLEFMRDYWDNYQIYKEIEYEEKNENNQ